MSIDSNTFWESFAKQEFDFLNDLLSSTHYSDYSRLIARALDKAVDNDNIAQIEWISTLDSISIEYCDDDTPILVYTVWNDAYKSAKYLLGCGLDINASWKGITPIALAASKGKIEFVRLFAEHGARLTDRVALRGFGPRNLLEIANGYPEVVEYLKSVAPELAVMEKVETVDPRKDLPFTYETLTEMIADASQKAFAAMTESRASEQFYGFAICTDDDASTIFPAGNTEESLAETDPEYRYFTNEWSCGVGVEFFDSAQEYLGKREDDDAEQSFCAFVEGLRLADSRGVFGTGESRKKFTLMVAGTDPNEDLEIKMEEWTKELNPQS